MENTFCVQAVEAFLQTLRGSFDTVSSEQGCIIITPFLRSDNECMEIEVIPQSNDVIRITDNSETIDYLYVNGLNVNRSKELRRQVRHIADRFGVELSGDELLKTVDLATLGQGIHALVSAVYETSFLIYKKLRRAPPTFYEEVEKFLISNNVIYDSDFKILGKTREHTFKFYKNGQDRTVLEPVSATSPHAALVKAERLAFRWTDIHELQPSYNKVAIVDDVAGKSDFWTGDPAKILSEYSDLVVRWSNKAQLIEGLAQRAKKPH